MFFYDSFFIVSQFFFMFFIFLCVYNNFSHNVVKCNLFVADQILEECERIEICSLKWLDRGCLEDSFVD